MCVGTTLKKKMNMLYVYWANVKSNIVGTQAICLNTWKWVIQLNIRSAYLRIRVKIKTRFHSFHFNTNYSGWSFTSVLSWKYPRESVRSKKLDNVLNEIIATTDLQRCWRQGFSPLHLTAWSTLRGTEPKDFDLKVTSWKIRNEKKNYYIKI